MDDQPPDDVTAEARWLQRRPGLRADVLASAEFQQWRDRLRTVVVDGATYYVRGGDSLRDEDQVVVEWIRRTRPALLQGGEE
ncbi:hypothetical protein SAMN06893096_102518 [Geodermatophilus pulveris]|uniref:Uncharacterized protein n=1 Tax=Geodermatophilus pulveris TaxID=1564159 RepID=A0A239CM77_9ACTN|nr:hypothetical protein [Geodermatophilus pulveris]SNS21039.1 hypothetical protein SAMN06893096_102518 [Geodermatophilus pulveris]